MNKLKRKGGNADIETKPDFRKAGGRKPSPPFPQLSATANVSAPDPGPHSGTPLWHLSTGVYEVDIE